MGAPEYSQLERRFGFRLSARERDSLPEYLRLLEKWNRVINLTGDSDPRVVLRDHIFEALWGSRHFLGQVGVLADIGSGAGFPGLFLALARPGWRVVLIERQQKRVAFLQRALEVLGLDGEVFAGPCQHYPGWPGVSLASLRAVRLDASILDPLKAAGVGLLWFHSRSTPAAPDPWRVLESQTIPGSSRRQISLLASENVSRETLLSRGS